MNIVLHYKTNYLNKSETFIDRLVRNHKKYRPQVLCYREKNFTDKLPVHAVPNSGFSSLINTFSFHLNRTLPFYKKTVRAVAPHILHAHFGYDAAKLMNLSIQENIPLVVSFYGADVSRLPSEFRWKKRYNKLADTGAHFIAATEFMKKQLINLGFPKERISIVRFGVDLESSVYIENNLDPSKMMMVGRMVEKKGFEYAIKAVYELQKQNIKVDLNLYGYGPLMDKLIEMRNRLSLEKSVHFHGYQPIETILEAHQSHSLLLAPSVTANDGDMEGLPNTILEAMAKGTPVVATKHAAIPEVIKQGKTGFLVEERDEIQLAKTLEKILSSAFNLDEIRKNARRVIEKEYCVQRMVQEIERIYERV